VSPFSQVHICRIILSIVALHLVADARVRYAMGQSDDTNGHDYIGPMNTVRMQTIEILRLFWHSRNIFIQSVQKRHPAELQKNL